MKTTDSKKLAFKKLIVFDLDGTLTATKAPIDREMAGLLARLLAVRKVAVIGGGKYALFRDQLLLPLAAQKELLKQLFLFPTTATSFYIYESGWKRMYALHLSTKEKRDIRNAFHLAFKETGYRHPRVTYGTIIEDRDTQMTFSALGQDVVKALGKKRGVALKEKWLIENRDTKMKIAKTVANLLPELEVHAAGFTSIDVTKKGIDKSYGLKQIEKHLHVPIRHMLFIGDAIFPGGNDYAVVKTGVDYLAVGGPQETKRIILSLLSG